MLLKEICFFTKCVTVERRRPIVKNTDLQSILVSQSVIKLLGGPE